MGLDGQGATTGADSVCHTSSECARTCNHARRAHSPERLKRRDRAPRTDRQRIRVSGCIEREQPATVTIPENIEHRQGFEPASTYDYLTVHRDCERCLAGRERSRAPDLEAKTPLCSFVAAYPRLQQKRSCIMQIMVSPSRLQDRKTRGSSGAAGLAYRQPQAGRIPLCVLSSESTQATTSLTSHENLSGNCFTKAVVIVSAMT